MNTYHYVCTRCKARIECHPTDPKQDAIAMVPGDKPSNYEFVCVPCDLAETKTEDRS